MFSGTNLHRKYLAGRICVENHRWDKQTWYCFWRFSEQTILISNVSQKYRVTAPIFISVPIFISSRLFDQFIVKFYHIFNVKLSREKIEKQIDLLSKICRNLTVNWTNARNKMNMSATTCWDEYWSDCLNWILHEVIY